MSLATCAQTNDLPGLLQRLDAGHGPDDPSEGENGFSPLFFAIVLGNTDIVGVLLSSGAKTSGATRRWAALRYTGLPQRATWPWSNSSSRRAPTWTRERATTTGRR